MGFPDAVVLLSYSCEIGERCDVKEVLKTLVGLRIELF
jgi:hypothetical protein